MTRLESKEYHSPFRDEQILHDGSRIGDGYRGNLEDILQILSLADALKDPARALTFKALFAPRVVIWTMQSVTSRALPLFPKEARELIQHATTLAQSMYTSSLDQNRSIQAFANSVRESIYSDALTHSFTHDYLSTWMNNRNGVLEETCDKLVQRAGGEDVLLLPIGYKSLSTALDLSQRYTQETGAQVDMMPVRYSRYKGEKQPYFTSYDQKFLEVVATGKKVVVFDELIDTGETLRNSKIFFQARISDTRVLSLAHQLPPRLLFSPLTKEEGELY